MQIKMKNKNKKIVIGSWKMQVQNLKMVKDIFKEIVKDSKKINKTEIVIAPPVLYLSELKQIYDGKNIKFASQDVFENENEKMVGEISVKMLKNLKIDYAIVGHPARRFLNKNNQESNEVINQKIKLCLENNIKVIFCIGEEKKDNAGNYLRQVKKQILYGLAGVDKKNLDKILFVYDPAWVNQALNSEDLNFMLIYIKKTIIEIFGKSVNKFIKILYGGGVNTENVSDFLKNTDLDGFILGRSSINSKKFTEILQVCNKS
jgi:triosephosphate isomerase (TIM)